MATNFLASADPVRLSPPRLPDKIPDLGRRGLILFQLIWVPALLLAVAGPLAGIWFRFDQAGENSALIVGSRVGLGLSEDDLTHVRFPVGKAAKAAGVKPGDDIIAIDGTPVAKEVPISKQGLARPHDATDMDYALFTPIIEGGDEADYTIRLRSRGGSEKDFRVRSSENHIAQAAGSVGFPPVLLSVVDLLHLLTYPFLLFAAWILHRRKPEDLISSVLSLAILLTIAAEQPSAGFLTFVLHLPGWAHRLLYDVGNICLLAGVLLFPFGQLRPRTVIVPLLLLPTLFLLEGEWYRAVFMLFMAVAVATLFARLRDTPPGDARQQIKWALFGFSGYTAFLAAALAADSFKLQVGSFGSQLLLELLGGFSFGLAFLCLQLGLMIALLRFRLYDAEVVISRSATFALVTVFIGGIFAGSNEAVKVFIQGLYGPDAGQSPGIFAAAIATVLVNPAQERIQRWSEQRFQRNLVRLRDDLPPFLRELRESASIQELLAETLKRIETGVRTTRMAVLVDGVVAASRGIEPKSVRRWLKGFDPASCRDALCSTSDKTFPVRVPLHTGADDGDWIGWLLVGPRPDGSLLSKDEQNALVDVAAPVTRAVRIVTRREVRESALLRRIEAIEANLSKGSVRPAPKREKTVKL
jgi:hypothetical protein